MDTKATANHLHEAAMKLSDEAEILYRQAFDLEKQAMDRVATLENREPTFSILCSSAAWLAFKADLPNSAIEIAERGLREGQPDGYIRHGLEWCIEWAKRAIEERG